MSHAERHPGINRSVIAPERTTSVPTKPETTGGSGTGGGALDPGRQNDPNFFKKHWKKLAFGATALLAAGGVVAAIGTGLKTDAPANPGPVPAEPAENPGGSPEQPEAGPELPVSRAELAGMSPDELQELTTVTRESVTVDGKIDWGLVVNRANDNFNLQVNAGATQEELDHVFEEGIPLDEYLRDKYDIPMEAGYAKEGIILEGTRQMHYENLAVADLESIRQGEVTVYTYSTVSGYEVVNETESSATIQVTYLIKDNFFSSGALEAGDKIAQQLNRTEDLNLTFTEEMTFDFSDGSMNLVSSRIISQ